MFLLVQVSQVAKQNFGIFKNDIKTKPKYFVFKDITKLLVITKKNLKRDKTNAFGPKFLSNYRKHFVAIQNFVSKMNIFNLF
jgi:hypothetical protein